MSTRKEAYTLIHDAQEFDAIGSTSEAFESYLKGISALSNLLLERNRGSSGDATVFDFDTTLAVRTLKGCAERLEEIVTESSISLATKLNCNPEREANSTTTRSTPSTSQNGSVGNRPTTVPAVRVNRTFQVAVHSPSQTFQKASRDNMLLTKMYESRMSRCRDTRARASLQLELQRRITENLTLAKKKDAEEYIERQKRERKVLQEAAHKLLVASKNGKIEFQEEGSIMGSQFNQQVLYAQILQYTSDDTSKWTFNAHSDSEKTTFLRTVMTDARHPLSAWLRNFQTVTCDRIEPLLVEYHKSLIETESQDFLLDVDASSDFQLQSICDHKVISKLESEAFERHLQVMVDDVRAAHELVTQMCVMMICNDSTPVLAKHIHDLELVVADYVYLPVWENLMKLFRIVYYKNENMFRLGARNMLMNKSNEELRQELSAGFEDGNVISEFDSDESATQLRSLIPMVNPYRKLKLMTTFIERLCSKVRSADQIGADQLVPLLVLLLLKCGSSQLVVECEVIEQLVNSKNLLGQEGYCLSSIQTALKYIEMHGKQ